MPETTYTYSIANDLPDGRVNTASLAVEIRTSSISTILARIDTGGDDLQIIFAEALPAPEKTILDGDVTGPAGGLLAAHNYYRALNDILAVQFADAEGTPKPVGFDIDGNVQMACQPRSGVRFNKFSFNYCDKCSWYQGSTEIALETLENPSEDDLTFTSVSTYWIDLTHGRVTFERDVRSDNPGKWFVKVWVDDVLKTQGTHYTVDYPTGVVTFLAPVTGVVTAQYWKANTSVFTVVPPTGKRATVIYAEVQFSKSIVLNTSMVFQTMGYAGIFAPALPIPPDTRIPIDYRFYERSDDYINESNGSQAIIPIWGGIERGHAEERIILQWKYQEVANIALHANEGMLINVYSEGNIAHGGESATITFYMSLEDDLVPGL